MASQSHEIPEENGLSNELLTQIRAGRNRRVLTQVPSSEREKTKAFLYGSENSPFDVFLRRSNQKPELAHLEASLLLKSNGSDHKVIVDIGASKGTLLLMLAAELIRKRYVQPVHYLLIEPDESSVRVLENRMSGLREYTWDRKRQRSMITADIYQQTWEEFNPQQVENHRIDAVLCSHTIYHFPLADYPRLFRKMIDMVRGQDNNHGPGKVIIAARRKDPIYQFIQDHFEDATGDEFNEKTIEDAIAVLEPMVAGDPRLSMNVYDSHAAVTFPFKSAPGEATSLVGFFLQKPWEQMGTDVQARILADLCPSGLEDVKREQIDGVVEIEKY